MAKLPPEPARDLSTDAAWEAWGRNDPYFGVITHPRFRSAAMDEEALRDFFHSGRQHADFVRDVIRQFVDPAFAPRSILDFGCGVGRVLVSFAAMAQDVVGLDVSPSMLEEARRNCLARGLDQVRLQITDDRLSAVQGTFDLVHTFIVLQHVGVDRVRVIFEALIRHVAPGGVGAVHLVYSKRHYAQTNGLAPPPAPAAPRAEPPPPGAPGSEAAPAAPADPEIQMNPYHMNEALFAMQLAGMERFHAEFTDHGGELGVFLFFQRPHGLVERTAPEGPS